MQELILGTVQLGLPYGISNKIGKPHKEEAFQILDFAYNNGISLLDTASGYGESESIIGEYMEFSGNDFRIATKLSVENHDGVDEYLEGSLSKIGKDSIELYFIHHFNDLKEGLIDELCSLRDSGKIRQIGISLYEPRELEYILSNYCDIVDVVQIPFNILDSRWLKNNLLKRTKEKNIKIYVRSIFLQGLIFMDDEEEMNKIDLTLKYYISELNKIINNKNIPMTQLAIDYVKTYDEIDGILVGCETVNQLKENVSLFNSESVVDDELKNEIISLTSNINEKIIDPRKW